MQTLVQALVRTSNCEKVLKWWSYQESKEDVNQEQFVHAHTVLKKGLIRQNKSKHPHGCMGVQIITQANELLEG